MNKTAKDYQLTGKDVVAKLMNTWGNRYTKDSELHQKVSEGMNVARYECYTIYGKNVCPNCKLENCVCYENSL